MLMLYVPVGINETKKKKKKIDNMYRCIVSAGVFYQWKQKIDSFEKLKSSYPSTQESPL